MGSAAAALREEARRSTAGARPDPARMHLKLDPFEPLGESRAGEPGQTSGKPGDDQDPAHGGAPRASSSGLEPAALQAELERAFERALRTLVPSLVHKLNNRLSCLLGDLPLPGRPVEADALDRAEEQVLGVTERLMLLTRFARRESTAGDVETLLRQLDVLVAPVGSEDGVVLEGVAQVRAGLERRLGLEPLLQLVVLRELVLTGRDPGLAPRDRRVRVRVAPSSFGDADGLSVFVTSSRDVRGGEVADAWALAALSADAATRGLRITERRLAARRCLRIETSADVKETVERPSAAPRLLLLEPDDDERALLAELLSAEGLRVDAAGNGADAARLLGQWTFALVLVSGEALAREPDLVPASLAGASDQRLRAYGGPAPTGVAHLPGPLQLEPLLSFVRSALSADPS